VLGRVCAAAKRVTGSSVDGVDFVLTEGGRNGLASVLCLVRKIGQVKRTQIILGLDNRAMGLNRGVHEQLVKEKDEVEQENTTADAGLHSRGTRRAVRSAFMPIRASDSMAALKVMLWASAKA
jgi:hypothetical protein